MAELFEGSRKSKLDLDTLRSEIERGDIDTVIVAFTDMQGRLSGKKISANFFISDVLAHGTEGCNYLLAVDVDMNTVSGYSISSWERGYGDMVIRPDLSTLRYVPWQTNTAMVQADLLHEDGTWVRPSPRQVLASQIERLEALGLEAFVGTELEFIVFDNTYEEAWDKGYRNMTPSNRYNVDYSLFGVTKIDKLLRDIRLSMEGASMIAESIKGECNLGQHEIAFKYASAMRTCDNHVVYKLGAKEIASQHGKAITFMAKYNEREGSSCHTHLSIRDKSGGLTMASLEDPHQLSAFGRSFIAGQLRHMAELTVFMAPNINSYKRFVEGSFAPTALAWGRDNRTCAIRLVGAGSSLRFENRVPGGDANPYLLVAAMIAAGLEGVEKGYELEEEFIGNAYGSDRPRIPSTLAEARSSLAKSDLARRAFGDDVVEHYLNMADIEVAQFNAAVTDWERFRSFERM
ncbi:MAG: glutamine synthetase family protein [Actinomycetota bacterium]|nr:glutamine synthetase family protein [Actinomycetota bacterium]